MRVTGGTLRGRRFTAPPGRAVRPTADRVRESLFARLGDLEGSAVLDLYAGSGALGLEAISRGAARVVFVDRSAACVSRIRRNLEDLGVEERGRCRRGDAAAQLRRLAASGERFDWIFVDPPYASDEAARALAAVVESRALAPGGRVVLEASRRQPPPAVPGLREEDARRYGDTLVGR